MEKTLCRQKEENLDFYKVMTNTDIHKGISMQKGYYLTKDKDEVSDILSIKKKKKAMIIKTQQEGDIALSHQTRLDPQGNL